MNHGHIKQSLLLQLLCQVFNGNINLDKRKEPAVTGMMLRIIPR